MAITRPVRKVAVIRRKLPAGIELPPEFEGFVALVTDPKDSRRDLMNVTWSDPRPLLNADKSAAKGFVPFLLFGNGGVEAFWVDGDALRVASCDSEGQFGVLAQDFRDFLALLANPGEALRQRLEMDAPLDTRALAPHHKPEGVPAATQEAFSQWVAGHALDANTEQTAATEVLRKTLHALARRMLEDGLSKVYKAGSRHWSMSFRLTQVENQWTDQWTVTYLDFGQWDAVPEKYRFGAILPELLPAMKTRKKSYELSIEQDGRVYADRGNQLELRP